MRSLLSITCCSKRHGVGNHAIIDDISRQLFNLIRELCHCRHRVLGSGDQHASLYPQLATSVSYVNVVEVQDLVNRGNVLDIMSITSVRDFTHFIIGSDCVLHHFAITLGSNMLQRVNHS